MNFYNEHDLKAAAWLRELIAAGQIPPGVVDTRSIADILPHELAGFTQCHFFAGIGGWSLALHLAGWPAERPVWTGSCPCQPFSVAGKGLGEADERHLWPVFHRLIAECRPPVVFGEQVASKDALRWLDGVFADLEGADYACGAADLCAAGIGAKGHPILEESRKFLLELADVAVARGHAAIGLQLREFAAYLADVLVGPPHLRQRLYWVAYADFSLGGQRSEINGGRHPRSDEESRAGSGGCGVSSNCVLGNPEGVDERRYSLPGINGQGQPLGGSGGAGPERLGQSDLAGREPGQPATAPAGHGCAPEPAGGASGMGEPIQPGLEGHAGHGHDGDESGRLGAVALGSVAAPSRFGFWDNYDLLPCLDGKTRRVESGTFPLAHGVSGRVGLLRGYGNAIVPQVAAQFIQACEEACGM